MRFTAGAATLGGMGVTTIPLTAAPTSNAELARLVEVHRQAYAALDSCNSVVSDAEGAFYQARGNENARQAKDEAHNAQQALLSAETAAFLALLAYPVSTLDELRTIVAVGKTTWWEHDTVNDEEAEALIAGIMTGRS